ncbi:MAG: rod shape-determining protein MreC [Paracoccaceae bacterium]|nr:rod shape-determining protein MreC [Paracoccaceae bacterium]
MARERASADAYSGPVRRLLTGLVLILLIGVFLLWRIDSPRAERLRANVVDAIVPSLDWAMVPIATGADMLENARSYARIYEQNQELRRELRQMRSWREAALQLEQQNAKLLDLNNVRLDPKLTYVTGVVLADSGSPFRQSVLLNVGARDGIRDGWATTDGLGLVGRISGVGQNSSRVLLLTDPESRVPVTIQPSGQDAMLTGDNTRLPLIEFVEVPEAVRPGDRVISSGDGGVFPAGLLVGQIALGPDGRQRLRLAADYERLEFLRVLRSSPPERIEAPGELIAPTTPPLAEATDG